MTYPTPKLTERQREILRLMHEEYSDEQIAEKLDTSYDIVGRARRSMRGRFGCVTDIELLQLTKGMDL